MAFNPIQSVSVGPGPGGNYTLQYPSNVATGDLLIVWVWEACNFSGVIAISDDQGNTYTRIADVSVVSAGFPAYQVHCVGFYATVAVGGNKPIVTTFNTSGSILQSGAQILEYPKSSGVELTTSASDDGTVGFATAGITTSHANVLAVALGLTVSGSTASSGWTVRNTWGGTFPTVGEDQTALISGTSLSETATSGTGSIVIMATFVIQTATTYTDSIALGIGEKVTNAPGLTSFPSAPFEMAAGETGSLAGTLGMIIPVSLLSSLADLITSSLAGNVMIAEGAGVTAAVVVTINQSAVLAISSAFVDVSTGTYLGATPIGIFSSNTSSITVQWSQSATFGLAQAIAASVTASMFGLATAGGLVSFADSGNWTIPQSVSVGVILQLLSDGQRAFLDAVAFGIVVGLGADSGKGLADSMGLGIGVASSMFPGVASSSPVAVGMLMGLSGQQRLDMATLTVIAIALAVQPGASASVGAILGLIIGASIRTLPGGLSSTGRIFIGQIQGILASIPTGLMPGLAAVFDQLVASGAIVEGGAQATITEGKVDKAVVNDV